MKLADKIASYSSNPRSGKQTRIARILPIFVFFFFFPTMLFLVPHMLLDQWLNLPAIPNPPLRMAIGGVMIVVGVVFLLMTLKAQRDIGKGTPMPLMATQKLVVQKPYAWTRNPLAFGLLNLYFGISIFMGSVASVLVVLVFTVIILSYIKFVEEKELEQRYGADYVAYKEQTPFLIPRPARR
jgi:protein-S-isoprenylcysteine O-methyltransferase Ste14